MRVIDFPLVLCAASFLAGAYTSHPDLPGKGVAQHAGHYNVTTQALAL